MAAGVGRRHRAGHGAGVAGHRERLEAESVWPAESVTIAVSVRVLLHAAFAGIVTAWLYGGTETVPSVVAPSAKRTRLTPKSSAGWPSA